MFTLFYKCDLCDFTLWSSEPKINKGLVRTNTNQNITYESSVINSNQENERKPFFTKVTLTFNQKNLQSIEVKPSPRPISMWNMKPLW